MSAAKLKSIRTEVIAAQTNNTKASTRNLHPAAEPKNKPRVRRQHQSQVRIGRKFHVWW
jgi:hypothetical protein